MARILVIDDEAPIRRLLSQALASAGHEVLEAADGREALRIHQDRPSDLVITDILMPEQDGLEVIMALRRDTPGLKIIAMSGGGMFQQEAALQMAAPLGALATLRKPFDILSLLEVVRNALKA